ncbi:N-acetylmuramoyl-L-alanine amidase [Enterococcus dispar]|uniref:N-acetylmuramoyl-L-alanine amidase n=1 Tax=Enterococcus dispar TaxID=44009 RepID=UPI0021D445F3|nr:N-acetylmuramoyl-L-alanine amidase [Enterococcus dispar]MCU7356514.1 N-acetylmuramoyl-L-alanine amidase [Enterococcus dispar]
MGHIYNWMGHSGSEPGASSILVEDTVTREARKIATAYFKKCGHTVTADNDNMSLVQRINASTDKKALIVEWHANVGGGTGTEVWYSQYDSGLGKRIATAMAKSVSKFGLADRGAKNSKTNRYGRLGILDDPIPTAVLVELIFLDSKNDTVIWNKNKKAIVETMCKAFLDAAGWKSTAATVEVSSDSSSSTGTNLSKNTKPLKDGKVGDLVKVYDALYRDSTGSGRSTTKRGKQGRIKRIAGNSKKYLIEDWGWAHPNDLQLVKRVTGGAATVKLPAGFTKEVATFVNGDTQITTRTNKPSLKGTTGKALKAHEKVAYLGWKVSEGYTWIYTKDKRYIPVRPVGKAAWGTFK